MEVIGFQLVPPSIASQISYTLMLELYLAIIATTNMINVRRLAKHVDEHDWVTLKDVLRGH